MDPQIISLLSTLDCPLTKELDMNDTASIINIMVWLEDTKIRLWEIDERETLRFRIGDDEKNWANKYSEYLEQLSCPYSWFSYDCIHWVISHAVHLSLEDLEYREEDDKHAIYNNSYDSITEFAEDLCEGLGVRGKFAESCADLMERIHGTIQSKLAPESHLEFDFPLGFNTEDDIVNQVALVLKMLHLDDFRNVQNNVNEILSLCQSYTANPKLNSSLGKVGR